LIIVINLDPKYLRILINKKTKKKKKKIKKDLSLPLSQRRSAALPFCRTQIFSSTSFISWKQPHHLFISLCRGRCWSFSAAHGPNLLRSSPWRALRSPDLLLLAPSCSLRAPPVQLAERPLPASASSHAAACSPSFSLLCFPCSPWNSLRRARLLLQIAQLLRADAGALDSPAKVIRCMPLFAEHFRWGRQEDAHEFLRYVVDACHTADLRMHKRLRAAAASGNCGEDVRGQGVCLVMRETFGGALLRQVKCLECKGESDETDEIMDISLDLPGSSSVADALARLCPMLQLTPSVCSHYWVGSAWRAHHHARGIPRTSLLRVGRSHRNSLLRPAEFAQVTSIYVLASSCSLVVHPCSSLLVIASARSGKTELIKKKAKPYSSCIHLVWNWCYEFWGRNSEKLVDGDDDVRAILVRRSTKKPNSGVATPSSSSCGNRRADTPIPSIVIPCSISSSNFASALVVVFHPPARHETWCRAPFLTNAEPAPAPAFANSLNSSITLARCSIEDFSGRPSSFRQLPSQIATW
jgi:hypothetical protein